MAWSPLCSLTTSWRKASTTRSFAFTLAPPSRDAAASLVLCPGAAVVAFAAAPATPREVAARAAVTATHCNFLITSSFMLGSWTLIYCLRGRFALNDLDWSSYSMAPSGNLAEHEPARQRALVGHDRPARRSSSARSGPGRERRAGQACNPLMCWL